MDNLFDEITTDPGALQPKELEAVYAISQAVAAAEDMDRALDEIIRLTRSVFIFDNMVIYLRREAEALEPVYARVVGRGRSAEADLAWGESTASQAIHQGQEVTYYEQLDGWEQDRLALRHFLGLPLRTVEGTTGALVFGRFGGPAYTPEQCHLAEFIAVHVGQLLGRQQLVERVANLEAERKLSRLQADFIATVTHELCTPLGFIKGYATTLLREDTTWDDATRREFLVIIDEEADRLRDLIDNLLDSSRLQAGTLPMQFQGVRLDTFLRDMWMRSRMRHEGLRLELDVDNVNPVIQADPTRLAQVFDNLIGNAVKYAPGAVVTISLAVEEGNCHIRVRDTGPGIAAEYVDRLFQRFYRVPGASASTRGTGLGLYICRQLVRAHNGEITAESKLGEGTTFHIYLPFAQATSAISPKEVLNEHSNSDR